jgi:hypothetical protein
VHRHRLPAGTLGLFSHIVLKNPKTKQTKKPKKQNKTKQNKTPTADMAGR